MNFIFLILLLTICSTNYGMLRWLFESREKPIFLGAMKPSIIPIAFNQIIFNQYVHDMVHKDNPQIYPFYQQSNIISVRSEEHAEKVYFLVKSFSTSEDFSGINFLIKDLEISGSPKIKFLQANSMEISGSTQIDSVKATTVNLYGSSQAKKIVCTNFNGNATDASFSNGFMYGCLVGCAATVCLGYGVKHVFNKYVQQN